MQTQKGPFVYNPYSKNGDGSIDTNEFTNGGRFRRSTHQVKIIFRLDRQWCFEKSLPLIVLVDIRSCWATEGAEFWIGCKRLKLLRKTGRLQPIQISIAWRRQCDIRLFIPFYCLKGYVSTKHQNIKRSEISTRRQASLTVHTTFNLTLV